MTENIDYKIDFDQAFNEIQLENKKLKNINLLVAGKSGVGKSTLINTVFGEELAATGVGRPVTDKINLIEKEGFPVRIYDTIGFEINSLSFDIGKLVKSFQGNEIQRLIKKVQSTETEDDDIHMIWYVISGTSSRIETAEIKFINWLIEQKLPVLIILSKCYDQEESEKLRKEIIKIHPGIKDVINVLAQSTATQPTFGMSELIDATFEYLPEGLKASFVHSQEGSIKLKRLEASKAVNLSMAATFGTGFAPLPGADAPLMMATQASMMAKITSIYGVDVDRQQVETALAGVLGLSAALVAGKSISSNLAKLLPGLGTVGGGLISGSVGMIITGALGRAYMELMEQVLNGKVDLSSVTPNELTDLLVALLPRYLSQSSKKK